MSDLEEKLAVSKHISRDDTDESWVSPSNVRDSRGEVARLGYDHVLNNPSYESDGSYSAWFLCSGGSKIPETLVQYPEESQFEPVNLSVKCVDIAPPETAFDLEEDYEEIEIIEGNVLEDLPDESPDLIYAIDAFQEFEGEEFDNLADEIVDSMNPEACLIFNSTYGVLDLFEQFESWSSEDYEDKPDEGFVREDEDGSLINHVESMTVEDVDVKGERRDVTTSKVQRPWTYDRYRSEFEDRGLEEVESTDIEAYTGSVDAMLDCINDDSLPEPDEVDLEGLEVTYELGVMRKPKP